MVGPAWSFPISLRRLFKLLYLFPISDIFKETEKYAHVTFFFNGGREVQFDGEERCMVPSPKVATYDLKPEMNADGVADKVKELKLKESLTPSNLN
jgi:hypothetical protein